MASLWKPTVTQSILVQRPKKPTEPTEPPER